MKVLAKLGLVTAAAATVLFVFIYEFQGPVLNRVMSQPPSESVLTDGPQQMISPADEQVTDVEPATAINTEVNTKEIEEISETIEVTDQPDEAPVVEEQPVAVETEVPSGPTYRIYGKITLSSSGEQLGGVNIMVPGSNVAKVSNPNGGYTIEVPENTRELVFIYRGKKLVRRIDPANSLVNVVLNPETMEWE